MKIVVDLPEWYLKGIQGIKLPHYVDELIMEGQPLSEVLDEIKAEIQAKYDSIPWRNNEYDDGWIEALEWVLFSILDNIGKAESEDT